MQKVERVKLKNGLRVNFLFDKLFTTSSIQMCFKIGWRHDKIELRGLAHLFEHLVGKRTRKFPGKSEFAKKLDELGIITNASTGPDVTVYFQNQIHENIFMSLEMLFEAIYNTNFELEDLEKEKHVVLNEAREYLDNDDSILWRQTIQNLFPNTTMEKFFFGDQETMKNITIKEFEDFYNIYRNPKNCEIFIATNNPKHKKKIVTFLEKFYEAKENKNLFTNTVIEEFLDMPKSIIKFSKIDKPDRVQTNLRLAYKIGNLSKRERVAYGIANSVLLGGFSGTLIQKLRDELGLIYWMSLGRNMFMQNISYTMFSLSCNKGNWEKVVAEIKQTIQNTVEKLNEKDIARTIPIKIYSHKSAPNAYEDLSDLMDSVIYDLDYLQSHEYLQILKTIKVLDVKKIMQKIFVEDNSTVCILE